MRDNRPVMTALFESAMAAGPASGALWDRLAADTGVLRDHLEFLQDRGYALPGAPTLIAAAIAAMLAMLAYALPPVDALPPADPDVTAADGQTGRRPTPTRRSSVPSPACCRTDWPGPPPARQSSTSSPCGPPVAVIRRPASRPTRFGPTHY